MGNFKYNEKREKIMKETLGNLEAKEDLYWRTEVINMELVSSLLDSLKNRRPVTPEHIKYKKDLEGLFENKKQYDKFIMATEYLTDFNLKEDLVNTRKIKVFTSMNINTAIQIINKLSDEKISAHNFFSNIPQSINKPEDWGAFIIKILNYNISQNTLFKLLLVSNHRRILDAPNKEKLLNELAYLETKQTLSLAGDTTAPANMLIKDLDAPFCAFSKSASDITSIGNKTFCCFKKGGVGEPLMLISLKSPIAGIIWGEKGNKTWFAYVWELVEYNKETKTFDINLVLDNIEANNRLDENEYYYIIEKIAAKNVYKKVYLGYMRNDIDIPYKILNTRHRKSRGITFFNKETEKYSCYDDSREIYDCIIREEDTNYEKVSVNQGDFHRIKYIIDFLRDKGTNPDYNGPKFLWNKEKSFYNNKIDRRFDVISKLDLDKSFVEMSSTSIKSFELYDIDGEFLLKYNSGIEELEDVSNIFENVESLDYTENTEIEAV